MADSAPRGRMTIGAVLESLKADFPDVSISKIRFLESEGLVKPERTPSGYRTFTGADVERLRYILTAQRDRFWPLKVIRDALDALDRGLTPAGPGSHDRPQVPLPADDPDVADAAELGRSPSTVRLTRAEIAAAAGLDADTLDALAGYGLLRADADGLFPSSALPVAKAAAGLASYGLEPRHLRPFRTQADREIGVVQQIIAPLRGRSAERSDALAAEVLHHCIALHTALVKASLHR